MIRISLAAAMGLLMTVASAHADKKKDDLRKLAIQQVGEVIAVVSLCPALRPNVENISLVLQRVGLNVDDVIDDAGKYSQQILPDMAASGGAANACAAGRAWYGPDGTKAPNFVILR